MTKWILGALLALTGCAGAYGRAKTTPDIIGTAAKVDTTIEMTITGKDTVKHVWIGNHLASAPAVDAELKHHELDVKEKVGVARAENTWPKFTPPFYGGNYGGLSPGLGVQFPFNRGFNPACLSGGQVTARPMGEQVMVYQTPICRP